MSCRGVRICTRKTQNDCTKLVIFLFIPNCQDKVCVKQNKIINCNGGDVAADSQCKKLRG